MKKVLSLLLAVVMIIGMMPLATLTAGAAEESATITFDDKAKRTAFDTSHQIWEENGIVVTNNKKASTSNVADYAKPARFYASSELIVTATGKVITKIEFACNNTSYATAMAKSSGGTASGKIVTVTGINAETYTVAKLTAQVRMDSITVYTEAGAAACQHPETMPSDTNKAATCTEDGLEGCMICAECEAVVEAGTVIPALGHNYVDGVCTTCGQADPTVGLTIVTNPQPATAYKLILDQKGLSKVLYFNGELGNKTYYLATTEDASEAVDVYLDAVDGGYQLYFLKDGVKTYIRVSRYVPEGSTYGKGTMELTTTQPTETMTYNTEVNTLIYTYSDSESYYIGTYGTYNTFSVSGTYYITGDNAGKVDTEQFPARFAVVSGGSEGGDTACQHTNTTTTPGTPATCTTAGTTDTVVCNDCGVTVTAASTIPALGHNYVDGTCTGCGDVAPVIPTIPTGNYQLVTDIAEITAGGKFVIVINYKGTPYAMGAISSGKSTPVEVVIKEDKVAYIEGVTPTWTAASYNGGIALVNGDKYVGYNDGTNFSNTDNGYAWTITANEDGTFYATASGDAARQIALYDGYGKLAIGAYSNTNLTDYYYSFGLNFYKLTEGDEMVFASSIVCMENGEINTIAEPTVGSTFVMPEVSYIPEGYTFAGWTTTDITEEVAVAPATVIAAGTEIVVGNDATYYALYTRSETVEGGTVYNLVTDAATLAAGDVVVIAAKDADFALGTKQNNNNRAQAAIAKVDTTITFEDDVQKLTLEAGTKEGTFAFNTGAGYLYAAHSSSNYLRTETALSDNSSWTVEIAADGTATIKAQGTNTRNWLRYNKTSSLFSCYASGQQDIVLYKETSGTATTNYYVTYVEPPVPENSAENPYYVEWSWNDAQTEATASVTVAAGTTYYCASYITGLELFINGTSYGVLTGSRWDPAKFTVVNDTDAEATYELKIVVPVGSMDNPDTLVMGENNAIIAEGGQGYFFTWTAEKDGTLIITMPEGNWTYAINNMTSYVYGDTQWSDSDPVVNPAKVEVKAGDVLQIMVNTYDPANEWVAPAGTLTITAAFEEPIEKFDIDVARMILGNALEFQFGVATSKIPDKTGYYAVIEKTWADGTTTTKTIPAEEWGKSGNYHAVVYDGLAAKEMGDTFYVTIYNADGVAVSNAREDSVRAYVERAYDSQKETGKTMMVDMLNYGAAAQVQFNYGTADLANSKLTDAQKAVGTAATPEMSNDQVKGTNYNGTRFILESRIQVQLAFKNMTSDMYAIYTYTNAAGKAQEVRVEGTDFVIIGGKPAGVELSALVYADARALVEVTLYNADGTVHGTAIDSIESCSVRSSKGDDVFVALMKFADAAKAHLYG